MILFCMRLWNLYDQLYYFLPEHLTVDKRVCLLELYKNLQISPDLKFWTFTATKINDFRSTINVFGNTMRKYPFCDLDM